MRNIVLALASLLPMAVLGNTALDEIIRIDAPEPGQRYTYVDQNGVEQELEPRCSGGPKLTPTGEVVRSDEQYAIYLRPASPDRPGRAERIVIALDGGGVCMEGNTCIGSALAGDPVYEQEIRSIAEVAALDGIANRDNPANPFRDYAQILIPYCTGDLHWGTRSTSYAYPGLLEPWTVHHHGFDNLRWALEKVKERYPDAREVVLAGVSAGGWGVHLALPEVMSRWSSTEATRTRVIIDSANVVTEPAYEVALGGTDLSGGVWGVENAIHGFLRPAFESGSEALQRTVLSALGAKYSDTRIGHFFYAFDEVSIFYHVVTNNLDNPTAWTDPDYLLPAALEWSARATLDANLVSAAQSNYRIYVAAGSEHTILPEARFYTEQSAQDVAFLDWVEDMVAKRRAWPFDFRSEWRNVSCFPFCAEGIE